MSNEAIEFLESRKIHSVRLDPSTSSARLYPADYSKKISRLEYTIKLTYDQGLRLEYAINDFVSSGFLREEIIHQGKLRDLLSGNEGLQEKTLLIALNQKNTRHIKINEDLYFDIVNLLQSGVYSHICKKTTDNYIELATDIQLNPRSICSFMSRSELVIGMPRLKFRTFEMLLKRYIDVKSPKHCRELGGYALASTNPGYYDLINSLLPEDKEVFFHSSKDELLLMAANQKHIDPYYLNILCHSDPYSYYKHINQFSKVRISKINSSKLAKSIDTCPRGEVSEISKRIINTIKYDMTLAMEEKIKHLCSAVKDNAPGVFFDFCSWVIDHKGEEYLVDNIDLSSLTNSFYSRLFAKSRSTLPNLIFKSKQKHLTLWVLDEVINGRKGEIRSIPEDMLTKSTLEKIFSESEHYRFSSLPKKISGSKSMAKLSFVLSKGKEPSFDSLGKSDAVEIFNDEIDRYLNQQDLQTNTIIDEEDCIKYLSSYAKGLTGKFVPKTNHSNVFDSYHRSIIIAHAMLKRMTHDDALEAVISLKMDDESKLSLLSKIMPMSKYEKSFNRSKIWSSHVDSNFAGDLGL